MASLKAVVAAVFASVLKSPVFASLVEKASGRQIDVSRWLVFFQIEVSLTKIDPNPATIAAESTTAPAVIVRITNLTGQPLAVKLTGMTDEQRPVNFQTAGGTTVPAHGSRIFEGTTSFVAPGWHGVTVSARAPTGRTITVYNPHGGFETLAEFGPAIEDSASIFVYGGAQQAVLPTPFDCSPEEPNRAQNGGAGYGGVIQAIAGDHGRLFAVSKGGAVWRSAAGGPWRESTETAPTRHDAPLRAHCIAVDPGNTSHVVVGERSAEAVNPDLDHSGLWDSRDGGTTWRYALDPDLEAGAQRIHAVAFTRGLNTLLVGTANGVARQPVGGGINGLPFDWPATAKGHGEVTALAMSETKAWALGMDRTVNPSKATLLISSDDGRTWTAVPVPSTIDLPGFPTSPVIVDNTAGKGNGNDFTSVGAFDDVAYLVFGPYPPGAAPATTRCPLLIYRPGAQPPWRAEFTNDNDGRGLGGRRFVKSYLLNNCPGYASTLGQTRQLIYCSGQGLQQAVGTNPNGTIQWGPLVTTDFAGNPNPIWHLHADIWDFHLALDYCPTSARVGMWAATDGGVFAAAAPGQAGGAPPAFPLGFIHSVTWVPSNAGLHTHNIHALAVVPANPSLIAYATQDNDGWWRKPDGSWEHENTLGDCDWAAGDAGVPIALLVRDLNALSVLTGFGNPLPSGAPVQALTVNANGAPFDRPTGFAFIQTLAGEVVPPGTGSLDAVMLAQLPLIDAAGTPLPDPPGGTSSGSRLVLLRNRQFALGQSEPAAGFQNWRIEADGLPASQAALTRFWSTGGRANPQYLLFASTPPPPGGSSRGGSLYVRAADGTWGAPTLKNVLFGGTYGPVFVNPYDPLRVWAVVKDPADPVHPNGVIMRSIDGGRSFTPDDVLTALVTASGLYPLGPVSPEPRFAEVGSIFHGPTMCNPCHMAFDRADPNRVAVASPFTGVFYASLPSIVPPGPWSWLNAITQTREFSWRAITPCLPRPFGYVSSLGVDPSTIYVGTEGRGILGVNNPQFAQPAAWLGIESSAAPPSLVVTVRDATGAPVPYARVDAFIMQVTQFAAGAAGSTNVRTFAGRPSLRADDQGRVTPTAGLQSPGVYVIDLTFPGDGTLAPFDTTARFTLP